MFNEFKSLKRKAGRKTTEAKKAMVKNDKKEDNKKDQHSISEEELNLALEIKVSL